MALTPTDEMIQNCEAMAKQIHESQPPDIGCILLLVNRRTGQCVMRAPQFARKQADAIFKSLIDRPQEQSNIIIPPSGFRV